jgi:hypothetical protein
MAAKVTANAPPTIIQKRSHHFNWRCWLGLIIAVTKSLLPGSVE